MTHKPADPRRLARLALLTAVALTIFLVEAQLPVLPIPGAKLGLANLVVIVALYTMGVRAAFTLSLVRIVLAGFTFGSPASMIYSLAGGMLSLAVMAVARKAQVFSATGVSVLGGVSHNVGQIFVAILVMENTSLAYYLPVLVLSGTAAGVLVGILAAVLVKRLKKGIGGY